MRAWHASIEAQVGTLTLKVSIHGMSGATILIGPNGSGKTTFLRIMVGAIKAAKEDIQIGDRCIADSMRNMRLPIEHRNVGYVPQGTCLFPHLSTLDNVAFGLSTQRDKASLSRRRALSRELLADLNCENLAERSVQKLSGGEKKKVAIARALITKPDLLLLDEPLSALDPINRKSMRLFLKETIESTGCPMVMTTHDVRDVVALNAWVYALEQGKLIQSGRLTDLYQNPASPFIMEFLGSNA